MLSGIGISGLILILIIALLLFGPSKLPELGRAFGRTLKEFKKGTRDIIEDDDVNGSSGRSDKTDHRPAERRNDDEGVMSSEAASDRETRSRRLPE